METSYWDPPKCIYKKLFPVDEWDRPGGFYSLADVPIMNEKVLEREGTVLLMDSKTEVYKVKDSEKGWTFILPMKDVEIIDKEETIISSIDEDAVEQQRRDVKNGLYGDDLFGG